MADRTRLIETPDELQGWISRHPERHRKVGPQECSCGWPPAGWPIAGTTWEDHESVMLISDLGDVLPSHSADENGRIPWADEVARLTKIIDTFHTNCTCEFVWPER